MRQWTEIKITQYHKPTNKKGTNHWYAQQKTTAVHASSV
jgi:hypothetical protein